MSQVTLDEVTNKLLLKYDQNFNGLYDKKVGFDSSIMNKEDVIVKENVELLKKDLKIKALQYACILVLLLSGLLILHALKKIDTKKLIIISILLIVIYVITMIVLYKDPNIQLKAVSLATGLQLKDYLKSELQDLYEVPYQCPYQCPPNSSDDSTSEENNGPPNYSLIDMKNAPTLNTDPQNNAWIDGSSPFFDGINKQGATYYECKWNGSSGEDIEENGMPITSKNKYSTIPCTYRQNYSQVNKYICVKNPNTSSIEGNCVNVSNY